MYKNGAMLAVFLLIYSAIAGRIERSFVSGPIVFTAAGFILGADGFGILSIHIDGEGLRLLAELTLAMVLFTDAASADFNVLKRNLGLPERLLLLGLPLTIMLGFVAAAAVFPRLEIPEMALLAAILAPTDAALGKPVVTNPSVPAAMREALNLESGLNDGICVPIVVLLLGLAVGTQIEGGTAAHVGRVVAEAVGIGLIVGLAMTWLTTLMLRFAEKRGWIGEHWVEIPIVALAAACFAGAQALGGSGFIACFVGGLLLSGLSARHKEDLLRGAEHMGEALALLTWVVFGGIVVARLIDHVTWPALAYAVLSLTVIRMLPVFVCLIGTRASTADKLFIGWFGPRGLATIVFAVLILDQKLPGNDTILLAAGWTVLLSVIAHGVTANSLVRRIAASCAKEGKRMVPRRGPRAERSLDESESRFHNGRRPIAEPIGKAAAIGRRIGGRILREVSEALPPTIFFFVGFNFIVLTANLLITRYLITVSNFMLATVGALVVGKAVLVAHKIPLFRRYDRAPLVRPILFKTAFYWVMVFFARLLERLVHFLLEGNAPRDFGSYLITTFSWHRFLAISLWLFVLFLFYVTVSEANRLLGPGEIRRLLFTRRPADLQINRGQRMRELLRLSRLADAHSRQELCDPADPAHREMIEIVQRLAR